MVADSRVDEEQPAALPAPKRPKLDTAESIVGMIRTLTVPAVAVFVIIAFFGPLSKIASILPDKFREASKVSYGGFLLEVQRSAERAGNPELAEMIGDLSQPSLRYLLNAPEEKRFFLSYSPQPNGVKFYRRPNQRELDAIAELEAKKLYECDTPIKAWESSFADAMRPVQDQVVGSYVPKQGTDAPATLNIGCELTHAGKSAVNLIIGVVTREIAAARSSDTSPPRKED